MRKGDLLKNIKTGEICVLEAQYISYKLRRKNMNCLTTSLIDEWEEVNPKILNIDEVAKYIASKIKGVDINVINEILELETQYMIENGFAEAEVV